MLPLAYFGIESSGLNLAVDLLILFVVVLYLSLIYWTYADARRRIVDPMLVGCATAASLFPFVGTIIYMILRPPEYLEDVRERELEMQAAEARLHAARPGAVPALRLPHRARLRALPELPAQAQGALRRTARARSTRPGRSAPTARPTCPGVAPPRAAPRAGRGRAARRGELVRRLEPARPARTPRTQPRRRAGRGGRAAHGRAGRRAARQAAPHAAPGGRARPTS